MVRTYTQGKRKGMKGIGPLTPNVRKELENCNWRISEPFYRLYQMDPDLYVDIVCYIEVVLLSDRRKTALRYNKKFTT